MSTTQLEVNDKTNTRAGWKKLTEKEYDNTKMLLEAGLGVRKVAEIQGRSYATIHHIRKSTSFENYHAITAVTRAKTREAALVAMKLEKQEATDEDGATDNASPADNLSHVQIAPTNHVEKRLDRIAVALERLADAWERQPEKKSSFFSK